MRQRIVAVATRPEYWLSGLLLWLLLSASRSLGSPWARVALTEALRWSVGIGLALTLGISFRHTKIASRFVVTLVGTLALLGIADGLRPEGGGLTGPYQDHQLYGSVLLLLLPLAVAVALTARELRWRMGAVAAVGAGTLCLFLSQTRSAWAGALTAALVFGGVWLFHRGYGRDWRRLGLSAAVLAGAVLSIWLLFAPPDLRVPLAARVGTLARLEEDQSWQERLRIWPGASRLAAAHPLCGIGLGRYPDVQWAWTQAGHPLEPSERPSLSEEAHDFYLQTAAEIGLVGLGLYLAALTAFVFQCLRWLRQPHRRRSPGQHALVIACLSMIAGQAVDALASPSWQFAEVSFFFWALLGVGMAAMRSEGQETAIFRFPPVLHRASRFAFTGALSIALAANVLPIGLLTPVEAYTIPTGYTYSGYAITPQNPTLSLATRNTVSFTLKCLYKNNSNSADVRSQDVTFDGPPSYSGTYFTVTAVHTYSNDKTAFSTVSTTRNVLTIDSRDVNQTLTVQGHFSVNGLNTNTIQYSVTVTP